MKYTSAQAAKLLRKLNEERDFLESMEARSREFTASLGEDVETVRPAYDYQAVQAQLEELNAKIRKVKHAINEFNLTHRVSEFDMSIDQLLIYIPQLSQKKQKLSQMKDRLPKERISGGGYSRTSPIVEYSFANYDLETVKRDYEKTADELARAQTGLDVINNSETFEIEI